MNADLTTLRAAAAAVAADSSNPLVQVRSVSIKASAKARASLHAEALDAGFHTFRGVGVSSSVRMARGCIPADACAEQLTFKGNEVTFEVVNLA